VCRHGARQTGGARRTIRGDAGCGWRSRKVGDSEVARSAARLAILEWLSRTCRGGPSHSCRTSRCSGRGPFNSRSVFNEPGPRGSTDEQRAPRGPGSATIDEHLTAHAAERQGVRRSDDGGGRFLGCSSSTCKMVTMTGALAAGSARQPGDAGSRWTVGVAGVAEVVESRRRRKIESASSEKLRGLVVLPSNKPLQRTQSPQGNWSNISEPLVRRPRR